MGVHQWWKGTERPQEECGRQGVNAELCMTGPCSLIACSWVNTDTQRSCHTRDYLRTYCLLVLPHISGRRGECHRVSYLVTEINRAAKQYCL